ncbi:heme exporter protein CcmB [soil metagenome]
MNLAQEVRFLVAKELLLEWRQKYALGGIVLYVVSTVFVVYTSLNQTGEDLAKTTWNVLFWITLLFTAVNAIAKSFTQESRERNLYYYTLMSPQAVILAKMFYNSALMILLTFIALLVFTVMIGSAVEQWSVFAVIVLLGSLGFSFLLSMISAIAAKAGNNATLMAILSFPVILPLIMILQKLSRFAFVSGASFNDVSALLITLIALDAMLVALSFILFPYLWRD